MNSSYKFRPLKSDDRKPVIDIYNYFIRKSFAAYPSETVEYAYYNHFLHLIGDYPSYKILSNDDTIIGFAFLHPYRPIKTFHETAEITYFILPEYTRSGIGGRVLESLISDAHNRGISKILASISSLNEQSLEFHKKHSFTECGRLPLIGKKFGRSFDVVYMIRNLQ
jgi:phosphinothricin acetyltransferase